MFELVKRAAAGAAHAGMWRHLVMRPAAEQLKLLVRVTVPDRTGYRSGMYWFRSCSNGCRFGTYGPGSTEAAALRFSAAIT